MISSEGLYFLNWVALGLYMYIYIPIDSRDCLQIVFSMIFFCSDCFAQLCHVHGC